jgi:glycosyltransferase involved in cell wall biosynthesis
MGVTVAVSQVRAVQVGVDNPLVVQGPVSLEQPLLSVIVPVYNGERFLTASLSALRASDLPANRWELIVVDDGSLDQSARIAARFADKVVVLQHGPHGPAYARNRGFDGARGAAIVFVDADVCVHPNALRRISETFEREPDVSAVFGAYDLTPTVGGLVSQYRNLLHRYVHQRDAGDAVTFWAGFGAVRATVFAACGGFDEVEYPTCSVEDIELGYRIAALGHRIVLRPEIQGKHIKHWTLRSMVATDVRRRGIPWMRLLMKRQALPTATLNIRRSEQVGTALIVVGFLALFAWLWSGEVTWLVAAATAVTAILALNAPLLVWFARHRGWWFALGAVPLRLLYYALNAVSVCLALLSDVDRQHAPSRLRKRMVPSGGSMDK